MCTHIPSLCNHLSKTCREKLTELAVIDICRCVCLHQAQIKAESRRQGSTGGSWGGLGRFPVWCLWKCSSVWRAGLISACQVTSASPPLPTWAAHGWLSRCQAEWASCFLFLSWEHGSVQASLPSDIFFLMGPLSWWNPITATVMNKRPK